MNTLTYKHPATNAAKFKDLVKTVCFGFLNDFFPHYLTESVVSRQLIMFVLSPMGFLYLNYCESQTPQNYGI